jgi:hypothetical protein
MPQLKRKNKTLKRKNKPLKRKSKTKRKGKSLKNSYSSIAKKIDKAIDSHFKSTSIRKNRTKSGKKDGPFSKKNPRLVLNTTEHLLNKTTKLNNKAYGHMIDLGTAAPEKLREKIMNNLEKASRNIESVNKTDVKQYKAAKINFIKASLMFWKMCDKYPFTKKCENKNAKAKISEYIKKLNYLQKTI